MTTQAPTTTSGNDNPGGIRIGMAPSPEAHKAAMAAFDEVEGAEGGEPQAEAAGAAPASAEGEDKGKRRVEVDAKKLEAEEAARKAKELEQPTSAAFKALRKDRRELESLRSNVESGRKQLEQMQTQLKERLDKADALEALEAELKSAPVRVLKKYGIDLSALNTDYFKQNDPNAEVKTLAEQLAEVKKQLAERDQKAEQAQKAATQERAISSAVTQVTEYVDRVADEFEAAAWFKENDPEDFESLMREAVVACARATGEVNGDHAIKMVDDYYKKRYDRIKPRLQPGTARTSPGPTPTAKLEKAPKPLGRAASTPVASKDPESYEERYKAALAELG